MPKVSVIIPTYNRAHFLTAAIDSVLAQTYKDYEILVVDDGSTDQSVDGIKRYGDKVRYIYQENEGPPGAMNTGVENTTGEYYVVLGNDDMLMPDMLERQLAVMENDPELAFVCSGTYFIDENGKITETSNDGRYREKSFKSLLSSNFVWHLTTVVRRSMADEVGHFDENLYTTHDYNLWIHLAMNHKFEYTDAPLAKFRLHPGNTSKKLGIFLQDHLAILDKESVASKLTFRERKFYRGLKYYLFGRFYAKINDDMNAALCYWKAVFTCPLIGAHFWAHEKEKTCFSLPYRLVKPWLILFYYLGRKALSFFGVWNKEKETDD